MTIAQQLKVTDFPFIIKDKNGNQIYCENSDGYWSKSEYDSNGKEIYWENSDGSWFKREYDSSGNLIYWEDSDGFWSKREWDANGNRIYCENSYGYIYDNRPKSVEVSMEEIAKKLGISVAQLRIKD